MSYYRPCPECGAALDPGERCDCRDIEKAASVRQYRGGVQRDISTTYKDTLCTLEIYKRIGVVSSMQYGQ